MITCDVRAMACAALLASTAFAQAENEAAARALFTQGRALVDAGRYAEACPKFEAASRLYTGAGLLLNLADCYEHTGRTASAWTTFGAAASAAERVNHETDLAEAQRRQAALEPRLSKLVIRVTTDAPGLVVTRDGTTVDRAAWGTPLPIDPGAHTISAEATDRHAWSSSVSVTDPGTITVEVPELGPLTVPAVVTTPPVIEPIQHRSYWTGQRVFGFVMTAVGLVAMGASGVLAWQAKSLYDTATSEFGNAQYQDSVTAVTLGDAATVTLAAGAGVALVGLIVWLAAPRSTHLAVHASGLGIVREF